MVMKFKTEKQKSIVCCVLDILGNCKSVAAQNTCINLTDFLIHRFDLRGFDILIDTNEEQLLKAAADGGYSHAVIVAAGTSLGLSDRLFSAIDDQCKDDFFIAGHLLDRSDNSFYQKQEGLFEIHEQFYIVNLSEYIDAGYPIIGKEQWGEFNLNVPIRSQDSLYNDPEIPLWIKQGTETKTFSVRLHGWNILDVGLKQNRKFVTLSPGIRDSKKYLYYEHDHVFQRRLSEVKYYDFFCNNFFAGWNSDKLRDSIEFEGPVEQYATVGIGFNWVKNLEIVGFTDDTKVIFTDINHNCLQFMKKMVEEWDGTDYASFYWDNKPMMPNNSMYIGPEYKNQINEQWLKFIEVTDNWKELWAKVKTLKYEYVLIDYTASFNFDWLEAGKRTLLNLSDLYTHAPFVHELSVKYRVACENNLIQKLNKRDPEITVMLTSRAAEGFKKIKNTKFCAKIKDFEYTDITDLKTPSWHINDWVSRPCGRPIGID
jgi:hypothetical protein